MTDVLTLPLDLSPEASRRLRDLLERDLAAGVDPGPRHAQIACLSDSLARSLHRLREAVGRALLELPAEDPRMVRLQEAASGMASLAQVVMDRTGAYRQPPRFRPDRGECAARRPRASQERRPHASRMPGFLPGSKMNSTPACSSARRTASSVSARGRTEEAGSSNRFRWRPRPSTPRPGRPWTCR